MYIGSTITGVLLVVACVIPIVLTKRNRVKRNQKYLDKLTAFAAQSACKIEEYEVWNETAIGVDNVNMKLFYIQFNGENQVQMEIDLKTVYECQVNKKGRTIKNQGETEKVIERLDLGIVFMDKNSPEMLLPFYDRERDSLSLRNELELLNKWVGVLNELIEDQPIEDQQEVTRYF